MTRWIQLSAAGLDLDEHEVYDFKRLLLKISPPLDEENVLDHSISELSLGPLKHSGFAIPGRNISNCLGKYDIVCSSARLFVCYNVA